MISFIIFMFQLLLLVRSIISILLCFVYYVCLSISYLNYRSILTSLYNITEML